jgi:hypothetical protein
MLSAFISVLLIGIVLWVLWTTIGLFRRASARGGWWTALIVIVTAGGVAGYRLARVDLRISGTFRWVGLPMPIGFFQLEEGRWTDFVPPFPVQLLSLLADVLVPIALMLSVLLLTWRLAHCSGR